jgi:hypothetical protein
VVGGVRDAGQGVLDLGHDLEQSLPEGMQGPKLVWGRGEGLELIWPDDPDYGDLTATIPDVPRGGGAQEALRGITQFMAVFGTAGGFIKLRGALRVGRDVTAGATADATFDPELGNVSTLLRELEGGDNIVTKFLDSKVGADALPEERLRARLVSAAAEGAILGLMIEPLMKTFVHIKRNGLQGTVKGLMEKGKVIAEDMIPEPGQLNMGIGPSGRRAEIEPGTVEALVKRFPQAKKLTPYLSEKEIVMLDRRGAKQLVNNTLAIVDEWEAKGMSDEMTSVALAGSAKRGWYRESGRVLGQVFGDDFPRFAGLLAATSPQTSVKSNLKNALNIWKNWNAAGRPQSKAAIKRIMGKSVEGDKGEASVLPAWVNNSVTALTEPEELIGLSGGKVDSFMRNIMGDEDAVTNDAWMATYFGIDANIISSGRSPTWATNPGKTKDYMAISVITRKAASKLSKNTGEKWTPREVQETVWSYVKVIVEMRRRGDPRTIPEIIKSGDVTDEVVKGAEDFATLMGADDIRPILEGTEYGKRIEVAIDERGGASGPSVSGETQGSGGGSAATKNARNLGRAGRRIEQWESN